jgi:hypothetical protein
MPATLPGPRKAVSIGLIAPLPPNLYFIVVKVSDGDYTLRMVRKHLLNMDGYSACTPATHR